MDKFFYIFYLCLFFISISVSAQEASTKKKDADRVPLLLESLDDKKLKKDLKELNNLAAAQASYHTEPLSAQTTNHTSQQSFTSRQTLPCHLNQEKTGAEIPPVGKTNSRGFAKLVEDDDGDLQDDGDFDPRGTSGQLSEQPLQPLVDYTSYTQTSDSTPVALYPSLEQASTTQPVVPSQNPLEYEQPISTSSPQQATPFSVQSSAVSVDHPYNTNSRPMRFNPFEVSQEGIAAPQPVAVQAERPVVYYGQPISANRAQQATSYATQPVVQVSPTTTQQKIAPPVEQFLPPAYSMKNNTMEDESVKIKKQAHQAFLIVIDTFYVRMDDDEVCAHIREALMAQIKRLRKQLPHEQNIDKWFLNLPIDIEGHTIAHLAAANLDPKLLQMAHMMGVDIFKPNKFNTFPEDTAQQCLLGKANLSPAQKKLLLPETAILEDDGKKKIKKSSTVSSSYTSVEEQRKKERYDEQKKQKEREKYEAKQRRFYERHRRMIAYFDKIKDKKK